MQSNPPPSSTADNSSPLTPPMVGNYSPTHSNQMCDQNQVTSSLQPMSPMPPMSPMDHQAQPNSPLPNQLPGNMVGEPMDVALLQQQPQTPQQAQAMVDPMAQYRRANGSDANSDMYRNSANNHYSMQSHSSPDPHCGSMNGHDMQMNDFSNSMMRKVKIGEDAMGNPTPMPQSQHAFLMSTAGPSESAAANGYSMNLKQEPDATY